MLVVRASLQPAAAAAGDAAAAPQWDLCLGQLNLDPRWAMSTPSDFCSDSGSAAL